ncbi:4-hydroxy-2-oxo-heptane-1,7-dioate aldolase [Fonsecaea pedrosoi]|nr:4-hydroxy-2-oxo-heptane-1,7-dioate aldolase [Fonsecaea pedrosoi]
MASTNPPSAASHNEQTPKKHTFVSLAKALGRPLLGTVLTVPSSLVASLAAQSFDWVMIDMEHSPLSPAIMTEMVQGASSSSHGSCLPVVRVPGHGVEWIKWALDSGAAGIIVPMVNNASEARQIIDRAIYPPGGNRSFGPFHAPFGSGDPTGGWAAYYQRARDRGIAVLPIIESAEGVQNVDEILGLDEVTGVFIGPYDLRLSLGLPGGVDGPEPEFIAAVDRICEAGRKHGKLIGSMATTPELVRTRTDAGMKFLLTTLDYSILASGFAASRATSDEALGRSE